MRARSLHFAFRCMSLRAPASSPSMPRSGRSIIACRTACTSSPARSSSLRSGRASCSGSPGKPDRLPTEEVAGQPASAAGRRCRCPANRRAAAAAVRVDRRLLSRAARLGAADGAAVVGGARRSAPAHRISPDRPGSRPADAAARKGTRGARGPAGHDPRTRPPCGGQRRGAARAGQRRRAGSRRGRCRPAAARPDPDHAPPDLNADQREAAASLAVGHRQGLRSGPARRRDRLGQDRSLFRSDRRVPAPGQAGARPPARNRADRAVPQALRGALRLPACRLALGPALVAAPPRLARDRQRRSSGDRRRPLGAVPALPEPRPDRRRRGSRAVVQAGGRRPVSRPRYAP